MFQVGGGVTLASVSVEEPAGQAGDGLIVDLGDVVDVVAHKLAVSRRMAVIGRASGAIEQ